MNNNNLDEIVKCNIDISSPVSNDVSFDTILLVVSEPSEAGTVAINKTISISKADELFEYGYTTEDAAYIAAKIAFSQKPTPKTLFVCVRKNTEDLEGTKEDLAVTLSRAAAECQFYGFHITDFKEPADVQAAISWAEVNEKLFAFEYDDYNACPVKNFFYYRSFGMYSGNADGYADEQPVENRFAALALMAKCFGYDPGTETWNLKELSTIVPSVLSTEQKKELEENHINTFRRYAGCNCSFGGYTLAGEWIDVIRFRDWLKVTMQTNVFNAIKVNRKVPFSDEGIGMIEGAMEETLKRGQNLGGIAATEYDDNANAVYGFKVTVPRSANLSEAERKSRKLSGCYYTARLAGAIHIVEIEGTLTF